jgi:hypothetical protein
MTASTVLTGRAHEREAREYKRDIESRIDAALNAAQFDDSIVASLADRAVYANAVRILVLRVTGGETNNAIIPALFDHAHVRLWRVALALGVITVARHNSVFPKFTLESITAIARSGTFAPYRCNRAAARLALAALGHLLHDWNGANRRERAAFLLGILVQRRGGA